MPGQSNADLTLPPRTAGRRPIRGTPAGNAEGTGAVPARHRWRSPVPAIIASHIVIGVAIALATVALVLHLRTEAIRDASNEIEGLSLVMADQAERSFGAVELVQTGIIEHLRLEGPLTADDFRARMSGRAVFDDLQSRIRGLPQIDALTAIDSAGNLVNFSRFWPIPQVNVADRDYFRALSAAGSPTTFIGEPVPNRGTGAWTIYLARKVTAADGTFLGLLLGAIRLDYFEQLYGGVARGAGSSFLLFRRDGIMLARYPVMPHIGESFASSAIFREFGKGGRPGAVIRQVSRVDGQSRLTSLRALGLYPLVVGAAVTTASVLQETRATSASLVAAALLLEVLVTSGAGLMLRQVRNQRLLAEANAAASQAENARLAAQAELALAQERARAARDAEAQNFRFDLAMSNMSQALCLFDLQDRLVIANRKFYDLYGITPTAVGAGTCLAALETEAVGHGTRDLGGLVRNIRRLRNAGDPATYTRDLDDGRSLAVHFQPVPNHGWLATIDDITERRRAEAQIVHMAHHDALTGLPNRALFHDRLDTAIARSRRGEACAVMCLDLDHFKAVNDTLGHPVGDALLQAVTARLRKQVRETDTVARLGGDEFAIVQTSVEQPTNATVLARRLIDALSLPYDINGHQVNIGVSIGITIVPGDGDDAVRILKNADMALYRAKAEGRSRYRFFEAEMDRAMQVRRLLELDLRGALDRDEFEVLYQPLIDIRTGTVSTLEALLRWHHPGRGAVSPVEFIPVAEEIGLITRLGMWALRRACSDAATWADGTKVAVNLSVVQFNRRSLVADVSMALAETGLDPHRLELEVTETVMVEDTDAAVVLLHKLRALGIGIAMDDFGTGYSSLGYLRRFPFTKVKIDRSFIEGLGRGGDCEAIVNAVTSLCDSLGIATVAEGVETETQLAALRRSKCTEVQGFLFSRPRPAAEVAGLCAALHRRLPALLAAPAESPAMTRADAADETDDAPVLLRAG